MGRLAAARRPTCRSTARPARGLRRRARPPARGRSGPGLPQSLNTWVDLQPTGWTDPLSVGVLEAAVRGQPPGPDLPRGIQVATTLATICPYRSLRPFREEDAAFFFGRETFTDDLEELVEAAQPGGRCGVLGQRQVVGGPGRPGAAPSARAQGRVWDILAFQPDVRPIHSLAAALLPKLEPELVEVGRLVKIQDLAGYLADGRLGLRDVVARVLETHRGTDRLLLVADQWEELYTQCGDERTRHRFIDELLEATAAAPLTAVLTVRGDFFDHALDYRPLVDRLRESIITLGPMSREELKRAVAEPARAVALDFEPHLLDRILDDVERDPGSLPLLEFALTELWERRPGIQLLHETYEDMGKGPGGHRPPGGRGLRETARSGGGGSSCPAVLTQLVQPESGD